MVDEQVFDRQQGEVDIEHRDLREGAHDIRIALHHPLPLMQRQTRERGRGEGFKPDAPGLPRDEGALAEPKRPAMPDAPNAGPKFPPRW